MNLRELRKRRGLTITELEERSECGRMFYRRVECGYVNIDNCRIGLCKKCADVLGVSLEEFYNAAKNTEPSHKVGSPYMVKGQPAKVRGDSWKYRRGDGLERKGKKYPLKPAQNTLEEP